MSLLPKTLLFVTLLFCSLVGNAQSVALMIIDMQPKFAERGGNHERSENVEKTHRVLNRQVELIEAARAVNMPIVVVEYTNDRWGRTNDILMNAIGEYKRVLIVEKGTDGVFDDRFASEKVEDYLKEKKVNELIISGANGNACVKCSIRGALDAGYKIWADSQAIIDFNQRDFVLPFRYTDEHLTLDKDEQRRANFNQSKDPNMFDRLFRSNENKMPPALSKVGSGGPRCSRLFKKLSIRQRAMSRFRRFFRGWQLAY